jgi:hypothetical protein
MDLKVLLQHMRTYERPVTAEIAILLLKAKSKYSLPPTNAHLLAGDVANF